MPITEDRILRLREFGLSEYAARAYLALLDLGVTEARDISKLTKVPSSKIYHILEQLHEKGLVDILPEFPKKYAPVPFSEYLDKLQSVHRKAADEIVRDREDLARLFSVIGTVEVGDRGNFSVVRGRRNVLEKKLELGNGAKRELLGMLSRGAAGRISHFAEMYSGMKARGVTPRILLPLDAASVPKLADLAGLVDIRAREVDGDATDGNVEILIVDGSRALLVNFVPDDDSLYAGRDVALYTDQEALVSALKALVETQWTRAAHFDARRAEIETGRPPEVTRVYSDERDVARAVAAAVERRPTEVLALSAVPAGALVDDPRATADRLAEAGTRVRTILQIPDLAMAEDCAAHAEAKPSEEYRHLPLRGLLQAWLFDDREAFLVITRGGDDPARSRLLVHTTVRVTLLALRGELEKLWEKAEPLERRLEALRRLPRHLQVDMALQGGLLAAVSAAHEDLGGAYAVLEDERIVSASPAWTARSGWAFGELVALPSALDAFAPDARADAALRLSGAPDAPSGEPWETVLLAKDGGRIECVAVLRPVGESRQIVLAWRDVTAERRAERALREEAQRLFEAAGLSPVPILPRGTEARPRIR